MNFLEAHLFILFRRKGGYNFSLTYANRDMISNTIAITNIWGLCCNSRQWLDIQPMVSNMSRINAIMYENTTNTTKQNVIR